jgi:pyocin large subunit-like protein
MAWVWRSGIFAVLATMLAMLAPLALQAGGKGFRNDHYLDEHYTKHGPEFGNISKQDYLKMAQNLRDAKVGPDVLEATRPDGGGTRFDKRKGWFVAFDADGTIRTFFVPNDGVRYFYRQSKTYGRR